MVILKEYMGKEKVQNRLLPVRQYLPDGSTVAVFGYFFSENFRSDIFSHFINNHSFARYSQFDPVNSELAQTVDHHSTTNNKFIIRFYY